jgi:YbbR domain-containing protein
MKHIGLKIIAFICGIALWLYAISLKDYSIEIEVPLILSRLPENLALVTKPPETIEVRVEGKAFELIRLRTLDANAAFISLDLHNVPLGLQRFEISSNLFSSPNFPNIRYLGPTETSFLELDFDTKISHTVPIKLAVEIQLDSGFMLMKEPTLEPSELTIHGARKALMRVFEVQTVKDHLTKLRENQSFTLPLNLSHIPSNIETANTSVQLDLEIEPVTRIKVNKIPVQLIGMYDRTKYSISPTEASVEITGGKKILDSLINKDIELIIEFNRFAIEDADSLSPTVRILKPIQSTRVQPEKFYLKTIAPDTTAASTGNTP